MYNEITELRLEGIKDILDNSQEIFYVLLGKHPKGVFPGNDAILAGSCKTYLRH